MNIFQILIDFFLHIDANLGSIIISYGLWTYPILFIIIFAETGLVVTPILPGDSLIFAAGALAGRGYLEVFLLFVLLSAAAIIGDTVNYAIGHYLGPKVFQERSRFFKREYLLRTKEFYERHGGKTIILARFMPIIRTFAPFVAGIGKMEYVRFLGFNIIGGLLWVAVNLFAGYFFGGLPFVKEHFSLIILAIVLISISPLVTEYIRYKINKNKRANL
ncbi:MAG: DedA family protein [Nanoarchaeota archaeon]